MRKKQMRFIGFIELCIAVPTIIWAIFYPAPTFYIGTQFAIIAASIITGLAISHLSES